MVTHTNIHAHKKDPLLLNDVIKRVCVLGQTLESRKQEELSHMCNGIWSSTQFFFCSPQNTTATSTAFVLFRGDRAGSVSEDNRRWLCNSSVAIVVKKCVSYLCQFCSIHSAPPLFFVSFSHSLTHLHTHTD